MPIGIFFHPDVACDAALVRARIFERHRGRCISCSADGESSLADATWRCTQYSNEQSPLVERATQFGSGLRSGWMRSRLGSKSSISSRINLVNSCGFFSSWSCLQSVFIFSRSSGVIRSLSRRHEASFRRPNRLEQIRFGTKTGCSH